MSHPTVQWLFPERGDCLAARPRLLVATSATRRIAKVTLHRGRHDDRDGHARRRPGCTRRPGTRRGFAAGEHDLGATVTDAAGQTARQTVSVKICKK